MIGLVVWLPSSTIAHLAAWNGPANWRVLCFRLGEVRLPDDADGDNWRTLAEHTWRGDTGRMVESCWPEQAEDLLPGHRLCYLCAARAVDQARRLVEMSRILPG
jgi:hypothetical protein